MLTLYIKESCPFCRRVVPVVDRLELEVAYKDIAENEAYADELIEKGGKRQVPYLVDDEQGVSMYESDDIIAHLQKHYGNTNGATGKARVHVSDATCTACEG